MLEEEKKGEWLKCREDFPTNNLSKHQAKKARKEQRKVHLFADLLGYAVYSVSCNLGNVKIVHKNCESGMIVMLLWARGSEPIICRDG